MPLGLLPYQPEPNPIRPNPTQCTPNHTTSHHITPHHTTPSRHVSYLSPHLHPPRRYSVDELWHVPHFEKMLYDNPQLAATYLAAFQATGDVRYARVAR